MMHYMKKQLFNCFILFFLLSEDAICAEALTDSHLKNDKIVKAIL